MSELNGATFSPDRKHRLKLWRTVRDDLPVSPTFTVLFIGLNSSTAAESRNDPTIRREMGFARDWGFVKMLKGNLHPYVTPDPKELTEEHCQEYYEENLQYLKEMAQESLRVVFCWGTHGELHDKGRIVADFLKPYLLIPPVCFGINKNGQPKHPLYLPKNAEVMKYGL
jgi:hypothetical protein